MAGSSPAHAGDPAMQGTSLGRRAGTIAPRMCPKAVGPKGRARDITKQMTEPRGAAGWSLEQIPPACCPKPVN